MHALARYWPENTRGNKELSTSAIVTIFQNPGNGKFRIAGKDLAFTGYPEIWNAPGGKILHQPFSNKIDISSWPGGMYFVTVQVGTKMQT